MRRQRYASSVNVKAQALLNAVKWIEQTHGQQTLATIIKACSPPVRERFMTAIAIEWHPVAEYCELLEVTERVIGGRPGAVSRDIGAASALANTQGLVNRAVLYMGTPEFLMRRITALWSQFNDRGAMRLHHLDRSYGLIEITDLPEPHALFCSTITGWCGVISEAVGFGRGRIEHVECRARGHAKCVWRFDFETSVSSGDQARS
jgi:hypothetical protein